MSVAVENVNRFTSPAEPDIIAASRTAQAGCIDFAVLKDPAEFSDLKNEWDRLHASNAPHRLAFQSHTWLQSWIETVLSSEPGACERLAVTTARVNGELKVICPFALRRSAGLSHLTWLGEPASQYGDIITEGTERCAPLSAAAVNFAIEQFQPDLVHLRKVRQDAAIQAWLATQRTTPTNTDTAAYLDLRDATSFDDYSSRYPAKARKNRRRQRRRLEECGPVTTTILPLGKCASDAIRSGIAFKRHWLIARGQVASALHGSQLESCLCAIVERPDAMAEPFISTMHSGETLVSVQFGVISNRRLALHLIAYNPATEKYGAGALHIEDTIAHCINNELTELDFLAPAAAYKQAWADGSVPVTDHVVARTGKGQLYARAYLGIARPWIKTGLEALPLSIRQTMAKHMQLRAASSAP